MTMTKKEFFGTIANMTNGQTFENFDDLKAHAVHELEMLANRKRSSKPTKTQLENMGYKETILNTLKDNGCPMTISALTETDGLKGLTNQRVSALVTQLKKSGAVTRTVVKGRAYFGATD